MKKVSTVSSNRLMQLAQFLKFRLFIFQDFKEFKDAGHEETNDDLNYRFEHSFLPILDHKVKNFTNFK